MNKQEFLNSVKRMIEKEEIFLEKLKSMKAPEEFIEDSVNHLTFYKKRLKEYKKYFDIIG